jgi:hypothetical protein
MKPKKGNRKALTSMAAMYGIKRRWFGLEPNFILRRRLAKIAMQAYDPAAAVVRAQCAPPPTRTPK